MNAYVSTFLGLKGQGAPYRNAAVLACSAIALATGEGDDPHLRPEGEYRNNETLIALKDALHAVMEMWKARKEFGAFSKEAYHASYLVCVEAMNVAERFNYDGDDIRRSPWAAVEYIIDTAAWVIYHELEFVLTLDGHEFEAALVLCPLDNALYVVAYDDEAPEHMSKAFHDVWEIPMESVESLMKTRLSTLLSLVDKEEEMKIVFEQEIYLVAIIGDKASDENKRILVDATPYLGLDDTEGKDIVDYMKDLGLKELSHEEAYHLVEQHIHTLSAGGKSVLWEAWERYKAIEGERPSRYSKDVQMSTAAYNFLAEKVGCEYSTFHVAPLAPPAFVVAFTIYEENETTVVMGVRPFRSDPITPPAWFSFPHPRDCCAGPLDLLTPWAEFRIAAKNAATQETLVEVSGVTGTQGDVWLSDLEYYPETEEIKQLVRAAYDECPAGGYVGDFIEAFREKVMEHYGASTKQGNS